MVGHLARRDDNRWSNSLTDWTPRHGKCGSKWSDNRWTNEIEKFAGKTWQRLAQLRKSWRKLGEVFVEQ